MIIVSLFLSFFKIGVFAYGGGYVILTLIETEVIGNRGWLTLAQFVDIIAMAEMTPGPIAINSATFVGYRIGGLAGAIAATLGVITPSFLLVLVIVLFLKKHSKNPIIQGALAGLRPAFIALISSAAIFVGQASLVDIKSIAIGIGATILIFKTKLHPIFIILLAGISGIIVF